MKTIQIGGKRKKIKFIVLTCVILPSLHDVSALSSFASTTLLTKFSDTRTEEGGRGTEYVAPDTGEGEYG
jgi:hypothetical protein